MAKTKQDGFPFSAIPRGKDLSLLWLACALAVIGIAPARAQTTEIVLHSFAPHPPKGSFPFAGVIRDSAGNLYGTTNHGGAANAGVVYKEDTAGRQTVLYSFRGGADGSYPSGVIGDSAGNFYGTTYEGGTPGGGTLYELDAAGHKTVLYNFAATADGFGPSGGLIRDSAGNLYGTTGLGGTAESGVVYELDATGHYTVLYRFTGGADGGGPTTGVIRDLAGNLYGTALGGTSDSGVVFKLDTTGHFTVLYTFTGGADGDSPSSGVIRDSAGNFYGTTSRGGASGQGVVYKLDTASHETVLYSFTGGVDGGSPQNSLTSDSAGNLYGTTYSGGAANMGVVYKLDTAGQETVLHSFRGGADGGTPEAGVIRDSAGNLYGTASIGGKGGVGTVYQLDASGQETVLYSFPGVADGAFPYAGAIGDSAGNLYGTTISGGAWTEGAVYRLDTAGQQKLLHSFGGGADGRYPSAGVIRDSAGNLYGTTSQGGTAGWGVVYKLDTTGQETVMHSFTNGADGGDPYAGVILDSAGNLFGTAASGGTANKGVVYKLDTAGQETVLYSFTGGADGRYPTAGVILDSAGNLYGTTYFGGTGSHGVVYKLDPADHEAVLYSFTGGADGGGPYAGVIRDSAGNLYGTTYYGGTANLGVVYKLDPAGHETVLYSFTSGAGGATPYAGVIRDSAGNLYGTTYSGGAASAGVVYKLDMAGHETVLYSFTDGADGGNPRGGVIEDAAGNLYGTTYSGGTESTGVIFKLILQ
jgi:uncharacterized repeat protein (TIGR03803 family)